MPVSNVYTRQGQNILAGPDNTFRLTLEDARPRLAAGLQQIDDAT
jgi:hypothetical protein